MASAISQTSSQANADILKLPFKKLTEAPYCEGRFYSNWSPNTTRYPKFEMSQITHPVMQSDDDCDQPVYLFNTERTTSADSTVMKVDCFFMLNGNLISVKETTKIHQQEYIEDLISREPSYVNDNKSIEQRLIKLFPHHVFYADYADSSLITALTEVSPLKPHPSLTNIIAEYAPQTRALSFRPIPPEMLPL